MHGTCGLNNPWHHLRKMSSWVGNPSRPLYVIPRGSAGLKKKGKQIFLEFRFFFFQMSDVPAGGRTVFPRAGAGVAPIGGSAVFWYNLKKSGDPDTMTLHGACPILYGTKWGEKHSECKVSSLFLTSSPSKFFSSLQSFCCHLSVVLLSYDSRSTLI